MFHTEVVQPLFSKQVLCEAGLADHGRQCIRPNFVVDVVIRRGYEAHLTCNHSLAIANGHGWNRFLQTVDQVLPRRGDTLPLPFGDPAENNEAAN